jgi:hypothetical protein
MENKEAIAVLRRLIEKKSLTPEEQEAILVAIGMLSWSLLGKSRLKAQQAKRRQSTEWQSPIK